MSDAVRLIQTPQRLRDQAIAALVPFFIDGPSSDLGTIRVAVASILDGYDAATPKELQLVTEIIAYGWAALACLRTAMAAKNLSVDDVLRLQNHAIALDRSSQKATRLLEARQKERARNWQAMPPEKIQWDEGGFQLAINQAQEKLNNANAKLAAYMATLTPVAPPTAKMAIHHAEPMTKSVLARRARH